MTVTIREDKAVHFYAPEQDRVLSPELVDNLLEFLATNGYSVAITTVNVSPQIDEQGEGSVVVPRPPLVQSEAQVSTVPSGEITTSKTVKRGPRPRK